MAIGNVIKRRRDELGLTLKELAARLREARPEESLTPSAVQQWEKGKHHPRPEWIPALSKVLRITRAELLETGGEVATPVSSQRAVPLISWVTAGRFRGIAELREPTVVQEWLTESGNFGENSFALTVVGDSMVSPYGPHTYPPGTTIVVDPELTPSPGRRVVARKKKTCEVTFRELQEDASWQYLKPLNPQYDVIKMTDEWEILGTVVRSSRAE